MTAPDDHGDLGVEPLFPAPRIIGPVPGPSAAATTQPTARRTTPPPPVAVPPLSRRPVSSPRPPVPPPTERPPADTVGFVGPAYTVGLADPDLADPGYVHPGHVHPGFADPGYADLPGDAAGASPARPAGPGEGDRTGRRDTVAIPRRSRTATTAAAAAADRGGNGRRRIAADDPRLELVDLAGFRGVAAVSVIVFHAYQFCRGDGTAPYARTVLGGVLAGFDGMISWFFLVSGFLLYMPMVNRVSSGRTQRSPKATLMRRGLRILPLYYTALLVVWAARNPTLPGDWRDLVEHLTFTQVFDSKRIFFTIGPAWSLAVEVYFYIYLSLVAGSLRRWQTHRLPMAARWRRLYPPAILPIMISALWTTYTVFLAHPRHEQWAYWFCPQNFASNFGFGMIAAILYVRWGRDRPLPAMLACGLRLFGGALIVAGALVRANTVQSLEMFYALSAIGFGVLFLGSVMAPRDTLWRRFFSTPVFVWLGMISYSMYLWHEPILLLVLDRYGLASHAPTAFPWMALLLVTAGILGGWISYIVLEQPGRRLSILIGRLRRRPAPATARSVGSVP